jgi:hypothetical protein
VGPRAVLDAGARRKILCPCWGSNLDHPIVQPPGIDRGNNIKMDTVLNIVCVCVDWIHVAHDRDHCWALVNIRTG